MQYQIQEMLRLERIFEAEKIQEELDAYNPLIPDGSNLKATMMIEFPDVEERRAELQRLIGIETALWLTVGDLSRVTPIANEDLDRETADKTSAVHFVRFEPDRADDRLVSSWGETTDRDRSSGVRVRYAGFDQHACSTSSRSARLNFYRLCAGG
ncbi:MAG: hypothetical protein Ct9H300mP16_19860 [Pseudomonadota bacterium]|nr:MAG: hypothetical protein Ct9H300mP16_19860 [Pseudomonadota bacterium]